MSLKTVTNRKNIYNNQQYLAIFNELREWMNIRHLDYKSQLDNILGNVLEEITEIARAKNDIHEKIDGLVDICVFCINASDNPIDIYRFNGFENMTLDSVSQFIDFTNCVMNNIETPQEIVPICFRIIENLGYDPLDCMLEVCKELNSRTGEYNEAIGKFIKDEGFYTLEDAQLAYPNYKVTEEPTRFKIAIDINDINLEDYLLNDEVQYRPKWHKANYSKCKLKEGR